MTDWLGRWSYPGIFVCVFIGNFGIPVCGELLICVENQQFATRHTQECRRHGISDATSYLYGRSQRHGLPF